MVRNGLRGLLWVIPPAFYAGVLLLLEVEWESRAWASIVAIAFAYLMLAVSFVAVPRSRIAPVLGMPLVTLASVYLVLTGIFGTVAIFVESISFSVVLVVHIVLAGAFLVFFLLTASSNETIAREIAADQVDSLLMRASVGRVSALEAKVSDRELTIGIRRLAEEFRYSPSRSLPVVAGLDDAVASALAALEAGVALGGTREELAAQIRTTSEALSTRNQAIRLHQ